MILYRANENLLYGDKRLLQGSIHPLEKLSKDAISILLTKERISMYRAPPLEMLPKFKYRTKRLKRFGIDSIELYGMSVDEIANKTGLNKDLLCRWKAELKDALGIKDAIEKSG
jgi:hypothetical protein